MNFYLTSLIVYAIPAVLVSALIYLFGRKDSLKWSPVEYVLIFVPWVMAILLANFAFENLDNAVRQLAVSQTYLAVLFVVGGVLGGLSLIPRFFFVKQQQYAILITSISSFVFATLFIKFIMLVFLIFG